MRYSVIVTQSIGCCERKKQYFKLTQVTAKKVGHVTLSTGNLVRELTHTFTEYRTELHWALSVLV